MKQLPNETCTWLARAITSRQEPLWSPTSAVLSAKPHKHTAHLHQLVARMPQPFGLPQPASQCPQVLGPRQHRHCRQQRRAARLAGGRRRGRTTSRFRAAAIATKGRRRCSCLLLGCCCQGCEESLQVEQHIIILPQVESVLHQKAGDSG